MNDSSQLLNNGKHEQADSANKYPPELLQLLYEIRRYGASTVDINRVIELLGLQLEPGRVTQK